MSLSEFLKKEDQKPQQTVKPSGSLADFLKKKEVIPTISKAQPVANTQAPLTQEKPKSWSDQALTFVKNIPTAIARTAAQPVEFLEKSVRTVVDPLSQAAAKSLISLNGGQKIKVSPQVYDTVAGLKKGFDTSITLPGQDTPLIDSSKGFTSLRDFLGSAGEAALNVGSAMVGGPGTANVVKDLATQGVKGLTKKAAGQLLADFALGSGFGFTTSLQDKDATPSDIAKNTLIGGTAGIVLPRALGGTARIVGEGAKVVGKNAGEVLDKTISKLEKVAEVPEKSISRYYEGVASKPTFKQNVAQDLATGLRSIQQIPQKAATALLDRYNSIKRFQEKARSAGIETPDLQELAQATPYRAAGKAENALDEYVALRNTYGEDWKHVKELSYYLDDLDRLANGNKIPGGRTIEDVKADIGKLGAVLSPEQKASIQQGQRELQSFLNQQLSEAVESGRLNHQQYAAIKAAHPNYIPHNVLDFLDDEVPKGVSRSFNMAKSGIEKAKGSTRKIDDIDNAIVDRIYRQKVLDEKNKTTATVIQTGKDLGGEEAGFIPLRTAEHVQQRIGLIQELKKAIGERNNASKGLKRTNLVQSVLGKRVREQEREMLRLAERAQAMAADFVPKSKIEPILDKIITRERRIHALEAALEGGPNVKVREELSSLVKERQSSIDNLRAEIDEVQDTNIKSVDIPPGFEKVSYYNNGVKEDWLIPDDIGRAMKNLDGQAAGTIISWMHNSGLGRVITAPARLLRSVATVKNPVFALISNPLRDLQTTQVTAKAGIKDLYHGLMTAIKADQYDPDLVRAARESGALQGSVFRENLRPEQILGKRLEKQGIGARVLKGVIRPDKVVESVGQIMEEMTRLAVFKRAIRDGLSPEQASKIARNATVDFGKSGTVMQVVNQVIPFINARVQGFSNLIGSVASDPTRAARRLMWTAAAPAALLNAHNQRYSSYYDIPESDKRRYWIIMVGETDGIDYEGNPTKVPHYIKIPKGDAQQVVSNTIERILSIGKQKYPESTQEFLSNLFQDTSPVTESSLLPTGLQQAIEAQTNYSFYRREPIEPQYLRINGKSYETSKLPPELRYKDSTSEIAKGLGKALGLSPIKIDYLIKTGILNDLVRVSDIPIKGVDTEDKTGFGYAAEAPFVRSLLGNSNNNNYLREKKIELQEVREKNREKVNSP